MTRFLPLFLLSLSACANQDFSVDTAMDAMDEADANEVDGLNAKQLDYLDPHQRDVPTDLDLAEEPEVLLFHRVPFGVRATVGVVAPACNPISRQAALALAKAQDQDLADYGCAVLNFDTFDVYSFGNPGFAFANGQCRATIAMTVMSCR